MDTNKIHNKVFAFALVVIDEVIGADPIERYDKRHRLAESILKDGKYGPFEQAFRVSEKKEDEWAIDNALFDKLAGVKSSEKTIELKVSEAQKRLDEQDQISKLIAKETTAIK